MNGQRRHPESFPVPPADRDALLGSAMLVIARAAIVGHLQGRSPDAAIQPPPETPVAVARRLHAPGACFVTLTRGNALRGCIGTLEAFRPLAEDVAANAQAAAFGDHRFRPLRRDELPDLRVEVSLLGPAEVMAVADEADALARLRPGRDGVILAMGGQRATFLPQVWDTLPEPRAFLAQLKQKAGLPTDYWSPAIRLSRYAVHKWTES